MTGGRITIDSISRTLSNPGFEFQVCRELGKVRSYREMTHILIRRSRFVSVKEKVDFMFNPSDVYLVLDDGERPSGDYIQSKQLQLLCLQIIPLAFAHVLIVDDNTTARRSHVASWPPIRCRSTSPRAASKPSSSQRACNMASSSWTT